MKFERKDFQHIDWAQEAKDIERDVRDVANAQLETWLAEAPVLKCIWGPVGIHGSTSEEFQKNWTHTARLVCITPIKDDK